MAEVSSSVPVTLNIFAKKGDTLLRKVTYTENGVLTDVSGDTILYQIRDERDNSLIAQGTIAHISTGVFTFQVADTVTADFAKCRYNHELEILKPSGYRRTIFTGKINFQEDIAQP